MDTANQISMQPPTVWVVAVEVASCVEPNGSLIRPLQIITIVGEDGVGLGVVWNDDSLKSVSLYDKEKPDNSA